MGDGRESGAEEFHGCFSREKRRGAVVVKFRNDLEGGKVCSRTILGGFRLGVGGWLCTLIRLKSEPTYVAKTLLQRLGQITGVKMRLIRLLTNHFKLLD